MYIGNKIMHKLTEINVFDYRDTVYLQENFFTQFKQKSFLSTFLMVDFNKKKTKQTKSSSETTILLYPWLLTNMKNLYINSLIDI